MVDSDPSPTSLIIGCFSLASATVATFRLGHGLVGVVRRRRLLILNRRLDVVRSIDNQQLVLNENSHNPSPYICTTNELGRAIVTFTDPVSGSVVYQFECDHARCYAGDVVLVADGAAVSLIAIDFAATRHRVVWSRALKTRRPARFLTGDDVVVYIADTCGSAPS